MTQLSIKDIDFDPKSENEHGIINAFTKLEEPLEWPVVIGIMGGDEWIFIGRAILTEEDQNKNYKAKALYRKLL